MFAYVSKDYVYKTQQELAQFEDTATAEALADEGEYFVCYELILCAIWIFTISYISPFIRISPYS